MFIFGNGGIGMWCNVEGSEKPVVRVLEEESKRLLGLADGEVMVVQVVEGEEDMLKEFGLAIGEWWVVARRGKDLYLEKKC